MLDQAASLICQQSFPMLGRASELYRFLLVSHRELADARWLLRARTIGAGSDIDSNRRFHQTGIKFHSQSQSEGSEFVLNLVKRFLAEVPILQHFCLGFFGELVHGRVSGV